MDKGGWHMLNKIFYNSRAFTLPYKTLFQNKNKMHRWSIEPAIIGTLVIRTVQVSYYIKKISDYI